MMLNQPQGNQIGSDDSQQGSRNHPAVGAVPVPTPTRMGIAGPGLTRLPRFAIWEGRSVPSRVGGSSYRYRTLWLRQQNAIAG